MLWIEAIVLFCITTSLSTQHNTGCLCPVSCPLLVPNCPPLAYCCPWVAGGVLLRDACERAVMNRQLWRRQPG